MHVGTQPIPNVFANYNIYPTMDIPNNCFSTIPLMTALPMGGYLWQSTGCLYSNPNLSSTTAATTTPFYGPSDLVQIPLNPLVNQTAASMYSSCPALDVASTSYPNLKAETYYPDEENSRKDKESVFKTPNYDEIPLLPQQFKVNSGPDQSCAIQREISKWRKSLTNHQVEDIESNQRNMKKMLPQVKLKDGNQLLQEGELRHSSDKKLKKVSYYNNILYKTSECNDYKTTGRCPRGIKCQFAHGKLELRTPEIHPLYRTEMCKQFLEENNCSRGSNCYYAHSSNELKQAPKDFLYRSDDEEGFPTTAKVKHSTSLYSIREESEDVNESKSSRRQKSKLARPRPPKFLKRSSSITTLS